MKANRLCPPPPPWEISQRILSFSLAAILVFQEPPQVLVSAVLTLILHGSTHSIY